MHHNCIYNRGSDKIFLSQQMNHSRWFIKILTSIQDFKRKITTSGVECEYRLIEITYKTWFCQKNMGIFFQSILIFTFKFLSWYQVYFYKFMGNIAHSTSGFSPIGLKTYLQMEDNGRNIHLPRTNKIKNQFMKLCSRFLRKLKKN